MSGAKVLLINNDELLSRSLRELLTINAGYIVSSEISGRAGLASFKENNFDVAIINFGLPDLDNTEMIRSIKKIDPYCVVLVMVDKDRFEAIKDMSKGLVYDFLSKPVNTERLFFLIRKGLEMRSSGVASHKLTSALQEQNASLQKQNILLAKRIEESTKNLTRLYEDLRSTYMLTIKALAETIDARDHYTHSHSENVAVYAVVIAEQMGLSSQDITLIREACQLHDLGKIGVEDSILSKPSALNEQEWEKIKHHPETAAKILEPLTFLNNVIVLIKQHHEHYDGTGYPAGLRGEEILLGARIIHLADAYEAMRSARSYRKIPLSKEEAVVEIKKNSGTQFDPKVVEAFLKVVDKL